MERAHVRKNIAITGLEIITDNITDMKKRMENFLERNVRSKVQIKAVSKKRVAKLN